MIIGVSDTATRIWGAFPLTSGVWRAFGYGLEVSARLHLKLASSDDRVQSLNQECRVLPDTLARSSE